IVARLSTTRRSSGTVVTSATGRLPGVPWTSVAISPMTGRLAQLVEKSKHMFVGGLGTAKQGDDVARPAEPAASRRDHECFLGFEQDLRRPLQRPVDAKPFGVAAVQLAQQMNDATPNVGRDQLQLVEAAFFDRTEQLIRFAQLAARCRPMAALPGPEAVLSDLENGALDHDLSSHDNPGMEERVESQEVYGGKLFKVYRDRVRLPSGQLTTREIVRHPGSVGIIPRDASGRIVLVRQFRYVAGREL